VGWNVAFIGQFCVENLMESDDVEDLVRWEDIIKMDFKESGCDGFGGVELIHLPQQW
jgi:hypothetical protein